MKKVGSSNICQSSLKKVGLFDSAPSANLCCRVCRDRLHWQVWLIVP